jgi:hypothetical protein
MKKNLKIERAVAITIYDEQDAAGKELLEKMWPNIFATKAAEEPKNITERVKTYEDACFVLNINPAAQIPYSSPGNKFELAMNAFARLNFIVSALNEGWEPNWSNSSEYKYYPWFKANESGFGFSYTYYAGWDTYTGVGSRLCFKSSDLAMYAGAQFEAIYNDFLTL